MDFIKRRILVSLIVFFVAVNLDFILPRMVPGNAAEIFASGTKFSPADVLLLEQRFGLNQPLYVQYFLFLKGIFGTWPPFFGISYNYYPLTVSGIIGIRLPWTLLLVSASLLLSFLISYILAAVSTFKRGGKFEYGSLYSSIVLWSIPGFWIGLVLIWIFSVMLGWLPVFGNVDFNSGTGIDYIRSVLVHAILPVITLTAIVFGQDYFLLRSAALRELRSDYVVAAESRGLNRRTLAMGYVLRNALLPLVSLLGYLIAILVSAVVVVEAVFGYPGIGDLIVDGILNRDYPVLEGTFFVMTVLVIVGGLIGDLL